MLRKQIGVIVVYCLTASVVGFAAVSAKELLLKSTSYFDKGQYDKALLQLASLNIRSDFDNSDDMLLAFKIRAIAYEQTGDVTKATETIKDLFFLDPKYQFNPFDTPKSVVALAQEIKAIIDVKTEHLASLKNEIQHESPSAISPQLEKEAERIVFLEKRPHVGMTLFPLGLNHFYLQSPVKGGMYLSLQALGLATNIAAYWWKQSYLSDFGSTRLADQTFKGGFETAQTIQYIGLGVLLVSYGISIFDALIHFQSIPSQKVSLGEITSLD